MKQELTIQLMDTHAGGDVSRIVTGGINPLPGNNVRAQMEYLRDHADGLKAVIGGALWHPRDVCGFAGSSI